MASPVAKCTGRTWLWPSLGMGYRDSQVEAEILFATMKKDPLPGSFQGLLPSAPVEDGMGRENVIII